MKILVTGAAGFIGFHLCHYLINTGHIVVGLDNINDYYDPKLKYARLEQLGIAKSDAQVFDSEIKSSTKGKAFQFIRLDLENSNELNALFKSENFEIVCNMAAQAGVRYSLENPKAYVDSNVVGFLNILECCRNFAIKHLLYASSSSVYGENKKVPFSIEDNVDFPISLYAATKKSNELMAHTYSHLYKIPTTGLRFFTVYGPWGRPDMAIYLFAKAIAKGQPIDVFNNGKMSRDFTYIDDIIAGINLILQNPPLVKDSGPPYKLRNIGNGSPQPLIRFIEAIENAMGKKARRNYLPMQPGDVPQTWADTKELELLGYKSRTNIDDGVHQFVKWFHDFHKN